MKLGIVIFILSLCCATNIEARTWWVSPDGSNVDTGASMEPFRTIQRAADVARATDTVMIREGLYREWVSPANGGKDAASRVVYMAAPGEEVTISGAEVISGWKKYNKNCWTTEVSNEIFGDFNPFAINISGDWLNSGGEFHLGEVYIDGVALREEIEVESVEGAESSWYAEVGDRQTTIIANFGEQNPNKSLTEINVRPTCFMPKHPGVDYIAVQGLKITKAATQWSAPTAFQWGAIAPNWSLGWFIDGCEVSYSKCIGICIGKDRASGENHWTLYQDDPVLGMNGFNRYIEVILKAHDSGWCKENIGSHIVQNNVIWGCGQGGIMGALGSAFCTIRNNLIYNINTDRRVSGFEPAGIKFHGAIDTIIEGNCIYNSPMGIWLDWQAQGSQIVGNVMWDNFIQDIFLEVNHGPTFIYNNVMLSDMSLRLMTQGVATFNNLIAGRVAIVSGASRYTPYHYPHSTKVKGVYSNFGGDMRFYNNIFLGSAPEGETPRDGVCGLSVCDKYPTIDEYLQTAPTLPDGGHPLPYSTYGNIHFGSSIPAEKEQGFQSFPQSKPTAKVVEREDGYYLEMSIDKSKLTQVETVAIDTKMLGRAIIPSMQFENPDGTPFTLTTDYFGERRNSVRPMVGAFEGEFNKLIWRR